MFKRIIVAAAAAAAIVTGVGVTGAAAVTSATASAVHPACNGFAGGCNPSW